MHQIRQIFSLTITIVAFAGLTTTARAELPDGWIAESPVGSQVFGSIATDPAAPTGATGATGPTGAVSDKIETTTPGEEIVLSDELTISRWALVLSNTSARIDASRTARTVRKLKTKTSDGSYELVLVLREKMLADGSRWSLVRLPMRGSGKTGWVSRNALSYYYKNVNRVLIDKSTTTLTVFRSGKQVFKTRVGIGLKKWDTPVGNYYVRERLDVPKDNGPYGPVAFGLSAYSSTLTDWPGGGIIGIHGTNQPGILPGRVSHGCVRVRNKAIKRMWKLVPFGTPVTIQN